MGTNERRIPRLAPRAVERIERGDGGFVLRSTDALAPPEPRLGGWLERWAAARPDETFLAERAARGWRRLTWAEALARARGVGQALVDRGLSLDRPVVVLCGNGIDHAVMMLGGLLVGVPVVPISVAYSLRATDFGLLRHMIDLVTPGLLFVDDLAPFAPALAALDLDGVERVSARPSGGATPLSALVDTAPGAGFEAAAAKVGPDTVAKILMTSGSTDRPKGVLTTHGMLAANQQQLAQAWPFIEQAAPVLVDWLPWSHTFGGSHNLNLVLRNGGTIYIDAGRPLPGMFQPTLDNLREVSPTLQFNVPAGYAMLVQALERDAELARGFFENLQGIFYAAAALPQDVWTRLDAVAERTLGHRIWMTTAWGSTETSPLSTSAHFPLDRAGNIGLPVAGCELAFVPNGDKLELRVRGPHVTPGYHLDPAKTEAAFDDAGFYRIGDAGQLADPEDPAAGIVFDGRVAEDFKLETGTWVNVGRVRTEVLSAAGGLLSGAVVVGHDRAQLGLLGWLDPAAAGAVDEAGAGATTSARVQAALRTRLGTYNATARGSSSRIGRVLLLDAPPSLDAGELTDKGYINARAVLRARAADVERLYGAPAQADRLLLGG